MEVEYEDLELNDIVKEVIGFMEKEALHRNIKVEVSFVENLPRISSDRGQLQQVFLNILTNAFAAVDDGGLISLKTWYEDTGEVGISIQDYGRGMSEEELNHIFEPFFTTKKGYGTGLGLPITYGIVKKMGGKIKVESKKGEGSTFTVYLPKNPKRTTE
jgi:two-component system NtrC family sensor kinase